MSSEIEKVQVSDITVEEIYEKGVKALQAINSNTEQLITALTLTIRNKANIEKGALLFSIKECLPNFAAYQAFLKRDDVNVTETQAKEWIALTKAYESYGDRVLGISSKAHYKIVGSLSSDDYHNVMVSEEAVTNGKATELSCNPQLRLNKFRNELAKAEVNFEERRQEFVDYKDHGGVSVPTIQDSEYRRLSSSYKNAECSVETWKKKINELTDKLADSEKSNLEISETLNHQEDQLAITTTKLNAVQEELDKMKFDDEISVGLMVKRTGYNLQNMVPQVLSDVQRFNATKGRFPEELRLHLETMIQQLTIYLNEHYA